jgi:hypothetical protein
MDVMSVPMGAVVPWGGAASGRRTVAVFGLGASAWIRQGFVLAR